MAARIGLAYYQGNRAPQAARWLARAVEIDREQPVVVHRFLGRARWDAGDLLGATEALEHALHLAPDDPLVLNELGYLYAERGVNLDRAVRLVRRALANLPPGVSFRVRGNIEDSLGWAHYKRGEYGVALLHLERADKAVNARKMTAPEITYHVGMAYLALGRRKPAVDSLSRAAKAGHERAQAAMKRLRAAAP
jgi:tetratricopeptide (TPR) repeat protein